MKAENQNTTITAQQDVFGNNILHQAAELGPFSDLDRRFGAVLQMQREIRWFKVNRLSYKFTYFSFHIHR